MKQPYSLSIKRASELLASGELRSTELIKSVFGRIREVEPKIDAYLTLLEEDALLEAGKSDKRTSTGKRLGRLDGIPIAVKDLLCTKGVETTAASKMLEGFVPCFNATVVDKLKRSGAIIIGKTNLDAFAHGSSTENSDFKVTKNPWDLSRVPGGSSGGSAAAVAADMCLGAIGTDTGGSIRQPASLCGVVGLKPTYGRVSRYGAIAMASSLDVVGPITKSARDAAIMLEAIAGQDELDATTSPDPVPQYLKEVGKNAEELTVGIPKEYFAAGMDEDVAKVLEKTIAFLPKLKIKTKKISLPATDYALATYYIIQPAEVSSNLARYDGIKYGYSVSRESRAKGTAGDLERVYRLSRGRGFGAENKRRIMLGTYVLSAGYYDAYYRKALKLRAMVRADFLRAFSEVDLIVTPVSPTPAFKIGEKTEDPIKMYLSDIYTVPINPAGVPAVSVPIGFVEREGKQLPVGMQIVAPSMDEAAALALAHRLERALLLDLKPKLASEDE